MKAKTYARLSLLIPFVIWGLLLVYSFAISSLPVRDDLSNMSSSMGDWIDRAIAFYVFGIIFWLLPYILLGLILVSLTFLLQPRVLVTLYVLSPFAMTILTLALTNLVAFMDPWQGTLASNPSLNFQDLVSFNILLVIFILVWGYICVGIGYGGYKLFQHLNVIKEDIKPDAVMLNSQPYTL